MKTKAASSKTGSHAMALDSSYVTQLNALYERDAQSWIDKGRLINEYVERIRRESLKPEDAYRRLAEHPDSLHKKSQLRNLADSYRLWVELGGESQAPKACHSHFILVLSSAINAEDKRELLEAAEQKGLSTAQLKQLIGQKRTVAPDPDPRY